MNEQKWIIIFPTGERTIISGYSPRKVDGGYVFHRECDRRFLSPEGEVSATSTVGLAEIDPEISAYVPDTCVILKTDKDANERTQDAI